MHEHRSSTESPSSASAPPKQRRTGAPAITACPQLRRIETDWRGRRPPETASERRQIGRRTAETEGFEARRDRSAPIVLDPPASVFSGKPRIPLTPFQFSPLVVPGESRSTVGTRWARTDATPSHFTAEVTHVGARPHCHESAHLENRDRPQLPCRALHRRHTPLSYERLCQHSLRRVARAQVEWVCGSDW